jgi:hypothetical protein
MTEPSIELFVNAGSAPELDLTPDTKIKNKAFNEPYKRSEERGYWHTEGNLPGLKFSPSNGIPEFLEVGFGNDWYSGLVYTLAVVDGTAFTRGNIIFGATSLARAEVVRVVTNTLWLTGVQGTFSASEDIYHAPSVTDYGTNTGGGTPQTVRTGYYCHKLDAVRNGSNIGVVRVHTVSAAACLADPMRDFSEWGVSTGKKKVFVTVKDAVSVPISGWMGAPCMKVAFKTGSATFAVGAKLKIGATVIGTITSFTVTSGAWTGDAAGYLFVTPDATARAIVDGETLIDDDGSPAAAVADQATIPAYLNNAVMIHNIPDASGSTQAYNGNVTTFAEEGVLTYSAVQRTFDQKSMTVFSKNAGDATQIGTGTKIKEIAFDITSDSYAYNVGILGRNISYPATEPAYPGGITDSAAFGSSARTFEIDGLTTGQAAQVNRARFSATWDFAVAKGQVISENFPTTLQPTTYNIIGTLDLQWKSNAMLKTFWNAPSGTAPAAGTLITKRIAFLLDSGEVVTAGYNKMLSIEVLGTIDSATLNRDADGYIQPVTIEAYMMDDTYLWGPGRFYIFDGTATH